MAAPARRAARRLLRDLPAAPPVGDRGAVAEVDPARDAREPATASPRSCGRYRLERSEGLVLRYLTDAWRTLDRSLPDDVYTPALEDVVEWLGELIRATDATLLDEWTLPRRSARPRPPGARGARRRPAVAAQRVAHRRAHRRVRLGRAAGHPLATLALAERSGWSEEQLAEAMAPVLGRVRQHRHRRRRPLGRAVHADRGGRPLGHHATTRRSRPATANGASSPSSTSSWPGPRAPRACGSTNSDRSDQTIAWA